MKYKIEKIETITDSLGTIKKFIINERFSIHNRDLFRLLKGLPVNSETSYIIHALNVMCEASFRNELELIIQCRLRILENLVSQNYYVTVLGGEYIDGLILN